MNSKTVLIAFLLAGTSPLLGQDVIAPPPKLDSTQTAVRDALYRLRDSLQLVDAASSSLARDRAKSSDDVLSSRARRLATNCAAAAKAIEPTRKVVTSAGLPLKDPRSIRPTLLHSLDSLTVGLKYCAAEFHRLQAPELAAELRDYGIGRGEKVQSYIRRHDSAVGPYFETVTGSRYEASRRGAGTIAAPH